KRSRQALGWDHKGMVDYAPSPWQPSLLHPPRRAPARGRVRKAHRTPSSSPLLLGIGKKQLLAVDLVARDGRLTFRRDKPVDECLAQFLLHGRIFFGVHQHDAVLIEQPLVALDDNFEIAAVLERYPGAAVGENIGAHRPRGIERGPHA